MKCDREEYDPAEEEIVKDFINMPLSELVIRKYDMNGAFLRLTDRKYPDTMWQYLTVKELIILMSDASEIAVAGAMMPFLDGLSVRGREKATPYEFLHLTTQDGTELVKIVAAALDVVKRNNNLYLIIGECGEGGTVAVSRDEMITCLFKVYDGIFLHMLLELNTPLNREEVLRKLDIYF